MRLQKVRNVAVDSDDAALTWPSFEHGVGDPVDDALIVGAHTRLVILEGLYLLHADHNWNLTCLLDECWYLDVPLEVALERLIQRHMAAWGMTRVEAQARLDANDSLNADIVQHSRARADWLIPFAF